MAVFPDLSGNGGGNNGYGKADQENMKPNRVISQAGGPWGNTVPAFIGEIVVNSSDKLTYRAFGTSNQSWEQIQRQNLE